MEFIKPALHGNTNRIQLVVCKKILPCIIRYMVAYFVHHVSDNYVDLSYLYVVSSDVRSTCHLFVCKKINLKNVFLSSYITTSFSDKLTKHQSSRHNCLK